MGGRDKRNEPRSRKKNFREKNFSNRGSKYTTDNEVRLELITNVEVSLWTKTELNTLLLGGGQLLKSAAFYGIKAPVFSSQTHFFCRTHSNKPN